MILAGEFYTQSRGSITPAQQKGWSQRKGGCRSRSLPRCLVKRIYHHAAYLFRERIDDMHMLGFTGPNQAKLYVLATCPQISLKAEWKSSQSVHPTWGRP
jgi:hypothetical protein